MATFRTLKDMGDIRGKRILVRSELNAPIERGAVSDAYRIEQAIPTLNWLAERGARVIVIAHLGRDPNDSLEPVYTVLKEKMPNTRFVPDLVGAQAKEAIDALSEGEVLLLENVRSVPGETDNDQAFAQKLASYADYYVNDAFGATHRAHASIVGVPALIPAFAGLLLEAELTELSKGLNPTSPSLFILGGAKFETKEALLKAILPRYDCVFIGGALANDFLKARGCNVGKSLVSEGAATAMELMASGKIMLPKDVIVTAESGTRSVSIESVGDDDTIVDIGPETITELGMRIKQSACILWNGPLGMYEEGYTESTKSVAKLVADGVHAVVGGGDTVASIRALGLEDRMGFLSTGGGAMLDYLVDGDLPGVNALSAH